MNYINLLIESFLNNKSCNESKLFVYCMGFNPETFKNLVSNEQINFIYRQVPSQVMKDLSNKKRSGYILQLKAQLIYEIHMNTSECFYWIDADSIIIGNIEPLTKILNDYDFSCTFRKNQKKHGKFLASLMGFSSTQKTTKFLKRFSERVSEAFSNDIEKKHWFYDQIALYDAYMEIHPKLYKLKDSQHSIHRNLDTIVLDRRDNMKIEEMKEIVKKMK